MAADKKKSDKKSKKKTKKNVPVGRCYIQCGFGNTIVTYTDATGGAVCWSSAGALGFKGSRKGTPFAAQVASEEATSGSVIQKAERISPDNNRGNHCCFCSSEP